MMDSPLEDMIDFLEKFDWIYNFKLTNFFIDQVWEKIPCAIVSLGTLVSLTNKTDRHDTTEILLKVALNTINQPTNLKGNCFHIFRAVDHGFESQSGQTKDWDIGMCYLSAKHTAL
jgi:hypothetical protein